MAASNKSKLNRSSGNPLPERIEYASGRIAARCNHCKGHGGFYLNRGSKRIPCRRCSEIGYLGIDPTLPTICPPGTFEAMAVLRARGSVEIDLRNDQDATLDGFCVKDTNFTPTVNLACGFGTDNGQARSVKFDQNREEYERINGS